jgi:hypothetical protein
MRLLPRIRNAIAVGVGQARSRAMITTVSLVEVPDDTAEATIFRLLKNTSRSEFTPAKLFQTRNNVMALLVLDCRLPLKVRTPPPWGVIFAV